MSAMHHLTRLAACLALAVCASAADLVIALKPDKNPEAMAAERQNLAAFLGAQTGMPVKVVIPLSAAVIQEGFANGTIDLGYLSGGELATAMDRKIATLLVAGEIKGKTSYESVWLAKADTTFASIAELKGRPVAFASRTSTSGFIIPRLDLVDRGLIAAATANPEEFFGKGQVSFGTGYVSAVEKVLSGQCDAAAVSDYVIEKDKHLTPEQKAQLRIVQRQGPVPTHVIAARTGLDTALAAKLQGILTAMDGADAALRDKVFGAKLVVTDAEAHLKHIRRALALPPLQ